MWTPRENVWNGIAGNLLQGASKVFPLDREDMESSSVLDDQRIPGHGNAKHFIRELAGALPRSTELEHVGTIRAEHTNGAVSGIQRIDLAILVDCQVHQKEKLLLGASIDCPDSELLFESKVRCLRYEISGILYDENTC